MTDASALPRFGDDVAFLKQHTSVVVLSHGDGASIAVAPGLQGRVMTSSASGDAGASYGWIHRDLLASRRRLAHINPFGGEDRFWLGPEGGQYALYFKPGVPFEYDHWQVPPQIDWDAWPVESRSESEIALRLDTTFSNYAGTKLAVRVDRRVRLLSRDAIGVALPSRARAVAFETENTLTNTGTDVWRKETGLLSIWILGMFHPSPATTVIVPFRRGSERELGPIVNTEYFGEVPPDRVAVSKEAGAIFFRGDGQHRSKIGVARARALPLLGSYDAAHRVLTVVEYTLPEDARDYVDSMWRHQERPYEGDVVNSYNDGPLGPGQPPMGPFYELETSSPALALRPGSSATHVHRTIHVEGDEATLDAIARAKLGVSLDAAARALPVRG